MHVHPSVAALRLDPGLQRRSRARMEAAKSDWLARQSEVTAALADYGAGAELTDASPMALLLAEHGAACDFVAGFVHNFIAVQRDEPLGEVPLRHSSSEGFARLQLMQSGGAVLSLCVYEPLSSTQPAPSARFADCALHEMIIAGSARGRIHYLRARVEAKAEIATYEKHWQAGDPIALKPALEAREFVRVERSLLILQLSRVPVRARPSCEYRLSDGSLVQQISGDKRASEQVMALGVLGALGHREGLCNIENFASDRANDPDARWEAVRQTLALDTQRGTALLATFASDDPLVRPARDLREHLIASHPALQSIIPENQ